MPFLQATAGALIPVSLLTMALLPVPVALALVSYLPLLVTLVTLVVEMAGLREFCATYGLRARPVDYLRLAGGAFAYQLLLTLAALRAAVRELRGERGWEKTAHVGAHRTAVPLAAALAAPLAAPLARDALVAEQAR